MSKEPQLPIIIITDRPIILIYLPLTYRQVVAEIFENGKEEINRYKLNSVPTYPNSNSNSDNSL